MFLGTDYILSLLFWFVNLLLCGNLLVIISLLSLISIWLFDCPNAVKAFFQNPSNLPFVCHSSPIILMILLFLFLFSIFYFSFFVFRFSHVQFMGVIDQHTNPHISGLAALVAALCGQDNELNGLEVLLNNSNTISVDKYDHG
jgi:hypothetical protein